MWGQSVCPRMDIQHSDQSSTKAHGSYEVSKGMVSHSQAKAMVMIRAHLAHGQVLSLSSDLPIYNSCSTFQALEKPHSSRKPSLIIPAHTPLSLYSTIRTPKATTHCISLILYFGSFG